MGGVQIFFFYPKFIRTIINLTHLTPIAASLQLSFSLRRLNHSSALIQTEKTRIVWLTYTQPPLLTPLISFPLRLHLTCVRRVTAEHKTTCNSSENSQAAMQHRCNSGFQLHTKPWLLTALSEMPLDHQPGLNPAWRAEVFTWQKEKSDASFTQRSGSAKIYTIFPLTPDVANQTRHVWSLNCTSLVHC